MTAATHYATQLEEVERKLKKAVHHLRNVHHVQTAWKLADELEGK